jgi:hypothetical protein
MIGGLASPPDSRYNSPLNPTVSSSESHCSKIQPPQFVKPSDLHDVTNFCGNEGKTQERDNVNEQVNGCLGDAESQSLPISRNSSLLSSSSITLENVGGDDAMITVESEMILAESSQVGEEVDGMMVVECEKGVSDLIEVDEAVDRMIVVEPKKQISDLSEDEEDNTMVDIESSSDLAEDKEDDPMTGAKSEGDEDVNPTTEVDSSKLSDLSDDEDDSPAIGAESSKPSDSVEDESEDEDDSPEIGVESSKPSDSAEGESEDEDESFVADEEAVPKKPSESVEDGDEGHPATEVDETNLSNSSEDEDGSVIGIKEANPTISVELSKMSLDPDASVHLAETFEPRRSARNTAAKDKPYRMVITPSKLSVRKKKPVYKKDVILYEVSV